MSNSSRGSYYDWTRETSGKAGTSDSLHCAIDVPLDPSELHLENERRADFAELRSHFPRLGTGTFYAYHDPIEDKKWQFLK